MLNVLAWSLHSGALRSWSSLMHKSKIASDHLADAGETSFFAAITITSCAALVLLQDPLSLCTVRPIPNVEYDMDYCKQYLYRLSPHQPHYGPFRRDALSSTERRDRSLNISTIPNERLVRFTWWDWPCVDCTLPGLSVWSSSWSHAMAFPTGADRPQHMYVRRVKLIHPYRPYSLSFLCTAPSTITSVWTWSVQLPTVLLKLQFSVLCCHQI